MTNSLTGQPEISISELGLPATEWHLGVTVGDLYFLGQFKGDLFSKDKHNSANEYSAIEAQLQYQWNLSVHFSLGEQCKIVTMSCENNKIIEKEEKELSYHRIEKP